MGSQHPQHPGAILPPTHRIPLLPCQERRPGFKQGCLPGPNLPNPMGCSLTGIRWQEIQGVQRKSALLRRPGLLPVRPGAGLDSPYRPVAWRNEAMVARIPPQDNTVSSPVAAASEPHFGTWAVHLDSLKALCSCPVPSLSCTDTEGLGHSCIFGSRWGRHQGRSQRVPL